jgi:hypothetical protein
MTKIEQINDNEVTIDFDDQLSKFQLIEILKDDLNVSNSSNPFICKIDKKEVKLFVKQITYLGNPHLEFKKRIQISKGWQNELKEENAFLIGLYKYKGTIIYTVFDKSNYVNRVTNNSSAHVSTFDLLKAQQENIFTKTDYRKNIISTIKREFIIEFLSKLVNNHEVINPEIKLFENFKNTLKVNYHGIDCYSEMIQNNYSKKFQPEWAGFYIEYKFEDFLNKNPNLKIICNYQSKKKQGEIDLDLNFNDKYLGDLKAHTNGTANILGNDEINFYKAIEIYGKIWYVVFNHNTIKDTDKNLEVTHFWNTEINKVNSKKQKSLNSYISKMKNEITFTNFQILEFNQYNINYLEQFKQGKNNNGKARKIKVSISKKNINNFLIYNSNF